MNPHQITEDLSINSQAVICLSLMSIRGVRLRPCSTSYQPRTCVNTSFILIFSSVSHTQLLSLSIYKFKINKLPAKSAQFDEIISRSDGRRNDIFLNNPKEEK